VVSFEAALAEAGVTDATLPDDARRSLDEQGYVVLRGAIPRDVLDDLRERFEAQILAHDRWPAPREHDTRHAALNADAAVRRICLSPPLLAAVARCLQRRFFLADVQGRDPRPGGGYQALHRDWPHDGLGHRMAVILAFLDPFGADNGATRLVPATHDMDGEMNDHAHFGDRHPDQVIVEGEAGDALVFQGRLVHSGMPNRSGAPRRTLQIDYRSITARDTHRETRDFSAVTPLDRYFMGAE
jgi:ectoine hydroxylase-related dioxygenase (phytanoyl-CoA dioxygenase family)